MHASSRGCPRRRLSGHRALGRAVQRLRRRRAAARQGASSRRASPCSASATACRPWAICSAGTWCRRSGASTARPSCASRARASLLDGVMPERGNADHGLDEPRRHRDAAAPGLRQPGLDRQLPGGGDGRYRSRTYSRCSSTRRLPTRPQGKTVLANFLRACGAKRDWSMASFVDSAVAEIRDTVGGDRVLCALSGGVDSSVVAALVHKAIGDQLTCLFVDNGLLRAGEAEGVVKTFRDTFKINLIHVDATERFLDRLRGVTDPEVKRKAIGAEFIAVFEEEARKLGHIPWLAQGTLYPDVIESVSFKGPSATIKTHHNVGGLPADMRVQAGRAAARAVQGRGARGGCAARPARRDHLAPAVPGPGLAIRVLGEVTEERLAILRAARTPSSRTRSAPPGSSASSGRPSRCCCRCARSACRGTSAPTPQVDRAPRRDQPGRHDRGLGAPALRPARDDLQPDHQRGEGRQPRRARHLLQAAERPSSGNDLASRSRRRGERIHGGFPSGARGVQSRTEPHGDGPSGSTLGRARAATLLIREPMPQRLRPPARPLRVQPARRRRPARQARGRGEGARLPGPRPHRPRQPLRRDRLLHRLREGGHQAHPGLRALRGPGQPLRALAARTAATRARATARCWCGTRPGYRNLDQARVQGLPRGLLLQAAGGPRAARPARRRAPRPVRLPQLRGQPAPHRRATRPRPSRSRAGTRRCSARTTTSWRSSRTGSRSRRVATAGTVRIAEAIGAPLCGTNDSHYLEAGHARAHEALLCIQTGTTMNDPNRWRFSTEEFYLKSADEMREVFARPARGLPQHAGGGRALQPGALVRQVPPAELPGARPASRSTRTWRSSRSRASRRATATPRPTRWSSASATSCPSSPRWASPATSSWSGTSSPTRGGRASRSGPGRGSSAGSLVAYCLGITNVDPIRYGLLFERFLNPERISMPDMDIDFADDRRDEVIRYVVERYGADRVAHIITFGTMGAKAVIRDVGRVLGLSYGEADRIAKLVPSFPLNITLDESLEKSLELAQHVKRDPRVARALGRGQDPRGRHPARLRPRLRGGDLRRAPDGARSRSTRTPSARSSSPATRWGRSRSSASSRWTSSGSRRSPSSSTRSALVKASRGIELDADPLPLDDARTYQLLSEARTLRRVPAGVGGHARRAPAAPARAHRGHHRDGRPVSPGPDGPDPRLRQAQARPSRRSPTSTRRWSGTSRRPTGSWSTRSRSCGWPPTSPASRSARPTRSARPWARRTASSWPPSRRSSSTGCKANKIDAKKAERIWELIEKFAGYGFNKCLTADTQIEMADGTRKPITEVRAGDLVLTKDGPVPRASACGRAACGQVGRLRLANGMSVRCTPDHPIFTQRGWVNAEDLRRDDFVAMLRGSLREERRRRAPGGVRGGAARGLPEALCLHRGRLPCLAGLVEARYPPRSAGRAGRSARLADPPRARRIADRLVAAPRFLLEGHEATYDFEVPGAASFIANGIAVHNSHAACYGLVAYQTAYLKANYPVEFMAALLTSEMEKTDKIVQYMEECRAMGLRVEPPDVNRLRGATSRWRATRSASAWPRSRTWAPPRSSPSCALREAGGRFACLDDFCARVDLRLVNRRVVESLIKAGAFDSLQGHAGRPARRRWTRRWTAGQRQQRDREEGQVSLFDALAGGGAAPGRGAGRAAVQRAGVAAASSSSATRRRCSASTSRAIPSSATGRRRADPARSAAPISPRARPARASPAGPDEQRARARDQERQPHGVRHARAGGRRGGADDLPGGATRRCGAGAPRTRGRCSCKGPHRRQRQGPRACSPRRSSHWRTRWAI